jgi:hypothetical protein
MALWKAPGTSFPSHIPFFFLFPARAYGVEARLFVLLSDEMF